jgi:hypothetical protein
MTLLVYLVLLVLTSFALRLSSFRISWADSRPSGSRVSVSATSEDWSGIRAEGAKVDPWFL